MRPPELLPTFQSPTGDATLPQWLVRGGLAAVAVAIVLKRTYPVGHPAAIAAEIVQEVALILGIWSQGVRK